MSESGSRTEDVVHSDTHWCVWVVAIAMTIVGCGPIAIFGAGHSLSGGGNSVRVLPPDLLAPPSALRATGTGIDSIHLDWVDESDNETGFELVRSNGGHQQILGILPADSVSYDDLGLAPGEYTYVIRSRSAQGISLDSNATTAATKSGVAVIEPRMDDVVVPTSSPVPAIQWATTAAAEGGTVEIAFSDDDGDHFPWTIAPARSDTGSFEWSEAPPLPDALACKLRITPTDRHGILGEAAESGTFEYFAQPLLYLVDFDAMPSGFPPLLRTTERPPIDKVDGLVANPTVIARGGGLVSALQLDSFDDSMDEFALPLGPTSGTLGLHQAADYRLSFRLVIDDIARDSDATRFAVTARDDAGAELFDCSVTRRGGGNTLPRFQINGANRLDIAYGAIHEVVIDWSANGTLTATVDGNGPLQGSPRLATSAERLVFGLESEETEPHKRHIRVFLDDIRLLVTQP